MSPRSNATRIARALAPRTAWRRVVENGIGGIVQSSATAPGLGEGGSPAASGSHGCATYRTLKSPWTRPFDPWAGPPFSAKSLISGRARRASEERLPHALGAGDAMGEAYAGVECMRRYARRILGRAQRR